MNYTQLLLIAVGGSVGATARYLAGQYLMMPTAAINLAGCLLIGILFGMFDKQGTHYMLLVVGVPASFTTFSTFSLETLQLYQKQEYAKLMLNLSTAVAGPVLTFMGQSITTKLSF